MSQLSRGLVLEIHPAAHAAHAAARHRRRGLLLRRLGHHRFRGDQETRNRSGALQRGFRLSAVLSDGIARSQA